VECAAAGGKGNLTKLRTCHFMDPKKLEYAALHAEMSLGLPWQAADPCEEAMRAEEAVDDAEERADMQELLLCYAFAEARPEEWESVAVRAHALLATLWPAVIAGRSRHELAAICQRARPDGGFPLAEVTGRFTRESYAAFEPVMAYYFPDGRQWLMGGVQNLYLVARLYQPGLVTRWGHDVTYEELARIFGEMPRERGEMGEDEWRRMCGAARARWSARAQGLIARKIEGHGGRRPAMYGKGAAVAEKYRAAAMGNSNRRK
jgi:hypothetical protein